MMGQLSGHITQITLKHDSSRVVQFILQFGTHGDRQKVLEELLVSIVEVRYVGDNIDLICNI